VAVAYCDEALGLLGDAVAAHDPARAARLHAAAAWPFALANRHHAMLAAVRRSEVLEPESRRSLQCVATAAVAYALRGDCVRARDRLALADRLAGDHLGPDDLRFVSLVGLTRIWLEDFAGARSRLDVALDRARSTGAAAVIAQALGARAELELREGDWLAAYSDAVEALRWAESVRCVTSLPHALTVLARIDAARGEAGRCGERLDRVRRESAGHGPDRVAVSLPAALGFAALSAAGFEAAAAHLGAAWTAAERGGLDGPGVVPFAGYPAIVVARGRGMLTDDLDTAVAAFGRARALHESCPLPFERARTLLCEAETMRRMRRPALTRPLLREAHAVFDAMDARPWAARTARELAAAGDRTGAAVAGAGAWSLTPQEFQIARAVADGLSNGEAAAALYVSRKTVEAHLTRVYRKLGLRSRTELARAFHRVSPS
jgi:DNA-binding CsgD family transcriptional regulator